MPHELRENDAMRFEQHIHMDWKPHVPSVDELLLVSARDHHGGALTTEAFDRAGCGFRGTDGRHGERCGATYATHQCRTFLATRLKRDVREAEIDTFARAALPWMREQGVDGVVLLPSEEGFSVTDPSPTPKGRIHDTGGGAGA